MELFGATGYLLALATGVGVGLLIGVGYLAFSGPGDGRRNALFMVAAVPLSVLAIWFLLGSIVTVFVKALPND
jgi:hypothetical protein